MTIPLGTWRRLQQAATAHNVFSVLALDHRGNLRRAFNPDNPDAVPDSAIAEIKRDVLAALAPEASAVLLDPETGLDRFLGEGLIPGSAGFIATVDATGYEGDPHARQSQLLDGWSVEQAVRASATGIKLLVYYHPDAPNAPAQEALVSEVAEACARLDVPFFLEPLSYSLDPATKKLPSPEKRAVVVETVRRLTPLGATVMKVEFPVNAEEEADERVWLDACRELDTNCAAPWLLLSAGVDFETYLRQVRVACLAGASGIMAGRAVWKEATGLTGPARQEFLATVARRRMARLTALCNALARPFDEVYQPEASAPGWYRQYPGIS